jgi:hypothetical protein
MPTQDTSMQLWTSLALFALLALPGSSAAGTFISPTKINSDVELQLDKKDAVFCKVNIHNSLLDNETNTIMDYVVGFGWLVSADADKSRSMVLVSGKLVEFFLGHVNGKIDVRATKQINPFELTVTVQGVPNTMQLEKMSSDLISDQSYLGHPVAKDGVTRNEDEQSIIAAVMNQTPMLVSMVMENSSDGTKTLRVVDNLSKDKRDAFLDCLQHATDLLKANDAALKRKK